MLKVVVCLFVGIALHNEVAARVLVSIYFDYGDNATYGFFQKQLIPTLKKFDIDLKFEPFGKANITSDRKKVVCPYGDVNCKGNGLIACFVRFYQVQADQLDYIMCVLPSKITQNLYKECVDKVEVASKGTAMFDALKACVTKPAYFADLIKMGDKAAAIQDPLEKTPTLTFNGKFTQELNSMGLTQLPRAVCSIEMLEYCEEYLEDPKSFMASSCRRTLSLFLIAAAMAIAIQT